MKLSDYLTILLSYSFIIPASLLCLAPMKNQLLHDYRLILIRLLLLSFVAIPMGAYITFLFELNPMTVLIAMLGFCFILYHRAVSANPAQSISVYLYVCSLMSVSSNMAYAIDALVNPNGGAPVPTLTFGICRLLISTLFVILFFRFFSRNYSFLIDNMKDPLVWSIRALISGVLLAVNISVTPQKYETLYVNNVFRALWSMQFMVFFLEFLIGIIFYFILRNMMTLSELQVRNNLMEMQERAYEKQQRYMEESARARHDFKHTIRTIKVLAENGDLEELNHYLDEYVRSVPENEIISYSSNPSLNAVLNYYHAQADAAGIKSRLMTDLPPMEESFSLTNTELCSMVGNILENAIRAASEQKEGERYLRLALRVEQDHNLYIVAVNSFDGKPLFRNGRYYSTRRKKSGIGLRSIASVAEAHGGVASFHHQGTEFFTDIMIPLRSS